MSAPTTKPVLETVLGKKQKRPPIWIMRQAGRYLPEYRELSCEGLKTSSKFVTLSAGQ